MLNLHAGRPFQVDLRIDVDRFVTTTSIQVDDIRFQNCGEKWFGLKKRSWIATIKQT